MPLDPGARLGPYEILGLLGSGGMGEVYAARDTRLERTVAIKVSKETFSERFRNEALAIAALNHPNIATLHDVGPDYLVMEHVEGKPARGPLPIDEALRLADQIADALQHAHQRGIVHRDLKPSNVLVTKSWAKVLDFGLAKRIEPRASGKSHTTLSEAGSISGTPRYMAPEQIDGKAADPRTDIFAFGLVLYEMLTGKHAFEATSGARVMAAILEKDAPPVSMVRPETPPALAEVVATCLAKDPAERWQSARELRHALRWAARTQAVVPAGRRIPWLALLAAAAAGAGLAGSLSALRTRTTGQAPVRVRLAVEPAARVTNVAPPVAVAPDGRSLALWGLGKDNAAQVFIRALDGVAPVALPGTEAGFHPFWSPDSQQIAFWTVDAGLKTIEVRGGTVHSVCKACRAGGMGSGLDHGASWGRTGVIVYSDNGKLFRVAAAGGAPEPLGSLVPEERGRFWPQFLPDGRRFLYLSLGSRKEDHGVYVGELGTDLRQRVVATDYKAAYASPGWLLYVREATLVAQRFDADRLELAGEPGTIVNDPVVVSPGSMAGGAASFSVSQNGVLAWYAAKPDLRELTWLDRSGRKLGTIGEPSQQVLMDLSRDDRTVAVCRGPFGRRDIWLVDAATGTSRRLTFDAPDDCGAVFSPDGKRIVFNSDRRGVREIYEKASDGSGGDTLLVPSDGIDLGAESWSADGRFLSYNSSRPGQSHDIFLLPLGSTSAPTPSAFLDTPGMETASALAPDGRYLAYHATEPGAADQSAFQVYVREITPAGKPGPGRWQVTPQGGFWPIWRPDGRELFYLGRGGAMAVEVRAAGGSLSFGTPKRIGVDWAGAGGARYRVSRDGQRVLFAIPIPQREALQVLVNWPVREDAVRAGS